MVERSGVREAERCGSPRRGAEVGVVQVYSSMMVPPSTIAHTNTHTHTGSNQ